MANLICPVVANRTAQRWPLELPSGGRVDLPAGQPAKGFTPFPRVAWVRRMESPAVSTTWDGTIPSVSDISFLHFLSLLADPTKLEPRLARRAGT